MNTIIAPSPIQRFYDNNNNPADKGLLFCYAAGTTTKQTTYLDQAGTPNTNPIVLNYRGECSLWLDTTKTYKFVFAPSFDTDPPTMPFWTVDNVVGGGTISSTSIKYDQTPAELAAGVTPVNYSIPSHDVCGYAIVERYGTNTTPGTTDMRAAAQNAVTVALQAKCNVGVLSQCRLASSINIDRQVDGAAFDSYFRVVGIGEHAGFYVTTAIAMFSTTIAFTTAPVTQLVSFENLNLEASGTGFNAYVLDDAKYLRTVFVGCSFIKIKCLSAPTVFCQDIKFEHCQARRWTGIFFNSLNVNFGIEFNSMEAEAGGQFAVLAFPVGGGINGGIIEGMSGTAVRAWGAQGWTCTPYMEQNDCDMDMRPLSTESSYGVTVGGVRNHTPGGSYAPSSQYSMRWGNCFNVTDLGCYGSTYLHELNTGAQVQVNGYAVLGKTNSPGVYYSPPYNFPAFSARNSVAQSITTTTFTKVTLGTEDFDLNANFSSSTDTPKVAGIYEYKGTLKVAGTGISRFAGAIYKNGTEYCRLFDLLYPGVASASLPFVSPDISMNGTTDYVELWVFVIATTPTVEFAAATDCTRFSGHYVRNNS